MARNISTIQNQIITNKESYTELDGLDSTSQTSKWNLFTYIVAVSISFLEQIIDLFKVDIETKLTNKVSGTANWIKANLLLFQYSVTDPQIVEIDSDFNITYPVVNTNLQIIKQVAIDTLENNIVRIKVAKENPPVPLIANEKSAVEGFLSEIMPAGINTTVISEPSDKILIEGIVYYNGMYSSVISANTQTAINTYLQNLPFGGKVVVSELQEVILNVTGVKDINITRIQARKDATSFVYGGNTTIYQLLGTVSDVNNRFYTTYAGYLVPETTTNYTLNDTLTYVIS